MLAGFTDYLSIAALVLLPWVFWKLIKKATKDCCPECINGGMMKGRFRI